jgi:hypothetical protein
MVRLDYTLATFFWKILPWHAMLRRHKACRSGCSPAGVLVQD